MKKFFLCCLVWLPLSAWAASSYPCTIRLMKSNCWTNYSVSVVAIDTNTQKPLGPPVLLPKGTTSITTAIPGCQPFESISFQATFSPAVWEGAENTVYPSNNFWQTPGRLPPKASQWTASVCFSNDFSSVPEPLDATGNCQCDFPKLDGAVTSYSAAASKE